NYANRRARDVVQGCVCSVFISTDQKSEENGSAIRSCTGAFRVRLVHCSRTRRMIQQTDVFVIGGGPAGLAAGIAARKKGFRVVVADGAQWPIEKACGEGLMPDSVAALRELGVSVGASDGQVMR